ncbi:hypothetical protein KCU85_g341, partial [Aureobasidium melanogenum]
MQLASSLSRNVLSVILPPSRASNVLISPTSWLILLWLAFSTSFLVGKSSVASIELSDSKGLLSVPIVYSMLVDHVAASNANLATLPLSGTGDRYQQSCKDGFTSTSSTSKENSLLFLSDQIKNVLLLVFCSLMALAVVFQGRALFFDVWTGVESTTRFFEGGIESMVMFFAWKQLGARSSPQQVVAAFGERKVHYLYSLPAALEYARDFGKSRIRDSVPGGSRGRLLGLGLFDNQIIDVKVIVKIVGIKVFAVGDFRDGAYDGLVLFVVKGGSIAKSFCKTAVYGRLLGLLLRWRARGEKLIERLGVGGSSRGVVPVDCSTEHGARAQTVVVRGKGAWVQVRPGDSGGMCLCLCLHLCFELLSTMGGSSSSGDCPSSNPPAQQSRSAVTSSQHAYFLSNDRTGKEMFVSTATRLSQSRRCFNRRHISVSGRICHLRYAALEPVAEPWSTH